MRGKQSSSTTRKKKPDIDTELAAKTRKAAERMNLQGTTNQNLISIAPDPMKKRMLMNRLYDSGISNVPLPSVERPLEKSAAMRPYSAKMGKKQGRPASAAKRKLQEINNSYMINQ